MQISLQIVAVFVTIITGHIIDKSQLSENSRRVARIANGKPVSQDDYPYVVGLRTENSDGETNFCTGTLVSPLFVLTAAHCIVETITIEVKLSNIIDYLHVIRLRDILVKNKTIITISIVDQLLYDVSTTYFWAKSLN